MTVEGIKGQTVFFWKTLFMKILLWNIHTGVEVTDFVTQVIRAKERDRRGSVVGKRVLICVTSFAYDPLWQTKKCGTQRVIIQIL